MKKSGASSGPTQRQLRVGEQVRHALATVLQHGHLQDPILKNVVLSVSEVRMSPDLKIATCFIAPLGQVDSEAIVKALNHHARFIRGEVSHELRQMKYMPEFRFRLDTSFDNFSKIDALLRSPEVARDLQNHDMNNDDLQNHDMNNDDLQNHDMNNDDLQNHDMNNDDLQNHDMNNDKDQEDK